MKITSPLRLGSAVAVLLFAANMSLRSQVLVESIAAIVGNEVIYL